MQASTLSEAEFYAFAEQLNRFATQLTPGGRDFLTMLLVRACRNLAPEMLSHSSSSESASHVHLVYAVWESTRPNETRLPLNPLPLPLDLDRGGAEDR